MECASIVYIKRIDALLGPLVASTGGGGMAYKPGSIRGGTAPRARDVEGGLRAGLAMAGFPIVQVSGG